MAIFERSGVPGEMPELLMCLNIGGDKIQLFDFAEQYSLDFLSNSMENINSKLIYDSGLDSSLELITLLEKNY